MQWDGLPISSTHVEMLHGLGNSGRLVSNLTPAANLGRKTVLRVLGLEGGTVVVEHGLLHGVTSWWNQAPFISEM